MLDALQPVVVALETDLFFSVRIEDAALRGERAGRSSSRAPRRCGKPSRPGRSWC